MGKQLTTEDFRSRAHTRHGGRYDYSATIYHSYHSKVEIVCPEHGTFLQSPAKHLSGRGCPKCAGRTTLSEYIKKAKGKHGDRYDYTQVIYSSCWDKIKISCKIHGQFEQVAREHLKYGCSKCAGRNRTLSEWVKAAKSIHGDRYDYSKSNYLGSESKIEIIC